MFFDSTTEKSSSLLHKTQTGHDVAEPRAGKERGDVGAVSEEELQSVGMGGLH